MFKRLVKPPHIFLIIPNHVSVQAERVGLARAAATLARRLRGAALVCF